WIEFVHPEDVGQTLARRHATLASGEVFEFEYRLRSADGTYRWHLGRAVPIHGAPGEIEFWLGTAPDIHDQKRIEQGQRFLLEAAVDLAPSLDYRASLERVPAPTVPLLTDTCR